MADFVNIVIPSVVFVGLALLALWAISTRRVDRRIAQLENTRLSQLEKQVAVDGRCFAHQARIHNRKILGIDERLQYMAREMRSERITTRPRA